MSEEQGLTPYETREILFYKTENGEVRVEILLFQENLLADTGKKWQSCLRCRKRPFPSI